MLKELGYSIIQIETNGKCNMACQFCPYPVKEENESALADNIVYKAIDEIATLNEELEYLSFSHYNEPLLDERIFGFISYAKNAGLKTHVITNGLRFAVPSVRSKLAEACPDFIKISLQSVRAETFSYERGISIDIESYFTGIYRFLEEIEGKKCKVSIDVACNFAGGLMSQTRRRLGQRVGDPSVCDTPEELAPHIDRFLVGLSRYGNGFAHLEKARCARALKKTKGNYFESASIDIDRNISLKIKPFFFGRRISSNMPNEGRFACSNRILGIKSSGSVIPCCLAYDDSLRLGDIRHKSLLDILEGARHQIGGIRSFSRKESEVCQRCFGEPTVQGIYLKNAEIALRHVLKYGLKVIGR